MPLPVLGPGGPAAMNEDGDDGVHVHAAPVVTDAENVLPALGIVTAVGVTV